MRVCMKKVCMKKSLCVAVLADGCGDGGPDRVFGGGPYRIRHVQGHIWHCLRHVQGSISLHCL
jgi:hypothetical protein